jgi:hypothetical protein
MGVATSRVAAPPTSVIDVELAGENAFATERIIKSPFMAGNTMVRRISRCTFGLFTDSVLLVNLAPMIVSLCSTKKRPNLLDESMTRYELTFPFTHYTHTRV